MKKLKIWKRAPDVPKPLPLFVPFEDCGVESIEFTARVEVPPSLFIEFGRHLMRQLEANEIGYKHYQKSIRHHVDRKWTEALRAEFGSFLMARAGFKSREMKLDRKGELKGTPIHGAWKEWAVGHRICCPISSYKHPYSYVKTVLCCGSWLTFKQTPKRILVINLETPEAERRRGQARALVEWLMLHAKRMKVPIDWGVFTEDGKKYVEPMTREKK